MGRFESEGLCEIFCSIEWRRDMMLPFLQYIGKIQRGEGAKYRDDVFLLRKKWNRFFGNQGVNLGMRASVWKWKKAVKSGCKSGQGGKKK